MTRDDITFMARHIPHAVLGILLAWGAVCWTLIALAAEQGA